MMLAVDFTFKGRIACASFVSFARHRAGRLDLKLDVGPCSDVAVQVSVEGAEALVDMFEMACSLGPYDCIVMDVVRNEGIAARAATN